MTDTLLEIDWRFSNLFPTLLAKMNATSTTEKGGIKTDWLCYGTRVSCVRTWCPMVYMSCHTFHIHIFHLHWTSYAGVQRLDIIQWIKRGWHNSDLRCYGRKQISSVLSKRWLEDFHQISFCSSCSLSLFAFYQTLVSVVCFRQGEWKQAFYVKICLSWVFMTSGR